LEHSKAAVRVRCNRELAAFVQNGRIEDRERSSLQVHASLVLIGRNTAIGCEGPIGDRLEGIDAADCFIFRIIWVRCDDEQLRIESTTARPLPGDSVSELFDHHSKRLTDLRFSGFDPPRAEPEKSF